MVFTAKFFNVVTKSLEYDKGQEISKAIFHETPLPQKQTKKDYCPVVILEATTELLLIFRLLFGQWGFK